jgi:alkylation response protein AidB-like acyl-CoA dehydrogenase
MRIQIGAMAVGTGLAMCDYVAGHRRHAPGADLLTARLEAAKELVYDAAAGYDADPDQAYLSSVAKLTGTRLAVEVGRWAAVALGPASLIEHPLLEKWTRDVCAFEFMDGTSNIQRLHVAQGYLKGARHA